MLIEDEETEASKSSAVDQHKEILAYETGKIPISNKAFVLANSLRLHRKTIPNIRRQRPASAMGNLEEPSTSKSTVMPKLYVRSLHKIATPETKEGLALLPSTMLRGPLESRRHKRPLYQTGSLALVAKVEERRSVPRSVTSQTVHKPVCIRSKENELRSEEEPDISEPLAEIDETAGKVAGVWMWLDTLLTAKTKATETPHSALQTFRIEAREKASRGFTRSKTPKMITMLEEKVSRLQHLVQDIEETEVWHPPTETSRPVEVYAEKRPGYSFYSVSRPALKTTQQIKSKFGDNKTRQTPTKETSFSQTTVLPKLRRRYVRYKPNECAAKSVEKLTANLEAATQYLQSVMSPGRLTELLTKIQSEKTPTDAMAKLEEALLQAAQKARDGENEPSPYVCGTPRPSQVPITQWRMLGIPRRSQNRQSVMFHSIHRGVHCRYALLAQSGFHKQNLSIAAHLTRMDLVDCINNSIQQ
ncbi:hypothetical protein P879_05811, partial [Paragonimus westermani]